MENIASCIPRKIASPTVNVGEYLFDLMYMSGQAIDCRYVTSLLCHCFSEFFSKCSVAHASLGLASHKMLSLKLQF